MTLEQRQAADRAMRDRDRLQGRSPGARGFPLPSPSPSASPERSGPEDGSRRKRRRTTRSDPSTPGVGSTLDMDMDEEDVPESTYDLTHEKLGEAMQVDKRLEGKIKRCFQQFLIKFTTEGATEPRYPDLLRKMAEEYQHHLDVSFIHL